MTKTEIIETLITIRDDLYSTTINLEEGMGEYIIIKYCVVNELLKKVNYSPTAKKKDIVAIIKREYIKSYSKNHYTMDNSEERSVTYLFMRDLVKFLNIKM